MKRCYWLPTRPYSLVDAINRMAVATGSVHRAIAGENSDYNGHHISFSNPNEFKPYWVAYYIWSGPQRICRGSLEECLRAAKDYYDQGARGASAKVFVETDEDAVTCERCGFNLCTPEIEAAHYATWRDDRFNELTGAIQMDKNFGIGAVGLLVNSKSAAEYQGKLDAAFAARRENRVTL